MVELHTVCVYHSSMRETREVDFTDKVNAEIRLKCLLSVGWN